MSKMLKISEDLSLPLDAATQTFAFIARKGAGKTYAAGKLAELLIDAGVQVVILDTVGNWYGLRLAADGKSAGFDVPVLGGLRGDIPLNDQGGALVADIIADTGRSLIVDVSQFSKEGRRRFATALGERLWLRKKAEPTPSPVHLIIEESQLIVPEHPDGGDAHMVGIYEEIIRLGRNYGIGCSMISQRPQSVNKEVLNQTECLVVLQTNGFQERKAIKAWVVSHGVDVNLIDELPSLPVGTAWVWSPQWLGILKKIKIAPKKTLDASATPKVGDKQVRRVIKPLDLDDLQEKMAATIAEAKRNDPKLMRAEIVKLTAELTKLKATPAKSEVKRVEVPVVTDAQVKRVESVTGRIEAEGGKRIEAAEKLAASGRELVDTARQFAAALGKAKEPVRTDVRKYSESYSKPSTAAAVSSARTPIQTAPRLKTSSPTTSTAEASPEVGRGGLRRILIALAQRPGLTDRQIGVRATLSSGSGTFSTYMSTARKAGWIRSEGEQVYITDEGIEALGKFDSLPAGRALLDHWLRQLGNSGAARMLTALAEAYPAELTNQELGEAANLESSSGTFSTYLSKLRTLELIQNGRDGIKASDEFFAE